MAKKPHDNMASNLPSHYRIREMSEQEFTLLFEKHSHELMGKSFLAFRLKDTFTQEEKQTNIKLKANMGVPYTLRLGAFDENDSFVGWHFGYQESAIKFYMCNSGVLPAHRGKGIYKALVKNVIDAVTKSGFQTIYSRHHVTNNAVIIPKLKAGFIITSLEIDDVHGTLVHLSYFPKPIRRKMLDYRSGHLRPDDEIKSALGLNERETG